MANHASAKKRLRQTSRKNVINGNRLGRTRTFIKRVENALSDGNADAAKKAFEIAKPIVMRAAQKGVLHKNMASRKISRLSTRVRELEK
ncbi:MAG: 30S ribosomal protein S20 [Pseudomonadota bacterium]|nr:30S ribosomal protein S20 [Pseudomonadota bacterium]